MAVSCCVKAFSCPILTMGIQTVMLWLDPVTDWKKKTHARGLEPIRDWLRETSRKVYNYKGFPWLLYGYFGGYGKFLEARFSWIFHVFVCLMDIFVGVCDTQGVAMKKMTGMAVLGDFSRFVGRVRVPNGPPQGACSLLTTRHIYCTTSKKICLISSIFQGVLFGSKGWCMVTPYHPWRHPLEDPGW